MKKIVIAPDSFKESFSALQAADAIERGFRAVFPETEYVKVPMADGGEGTVQAMVSVLNGHLRTVEVQDPLGRTIKASYGLSGDKTVAIIEMAEASGLHLLTPAERNPLYTTSYGTGQLVADALEQGVEKIILGVGGSATNDGGAGMAQALGVKLLNENMESIGIGGQALRALHVIEMDRLHPRIHDVTIHVACDVENPLLGEQGASAVYGPQKGATADMVKQLEQNLAHYGAIVWKQLGIEVRTTEGAGAAGGLAAGLLAFLNGTLRSGVDLVLETIDFPSKIAGADLVITGEGRLDRQTIYGKTPIGVAREAKKEDCFVVAIAGGLSPGHELIYEHGIDAAFSLVPGVISLEDAMTNGLSYLEQLSKNLAKMMKMNQKANLSELS